MTTASFPYFNAKILLFGEYSLMVGSKALSMPLPLFRGQLTFSKEENLQGVEIQSNHNLLQYARALKKFSEDKKESLTVSFDFDKLFHDLEQGLFFESTIPQGYGLGSSGALVAAIYDGYGQNVKRSGNSFSNEEIGKLKSDFSIMESYFHGKSSGLDPLICFVSKPMMVEDNGKLHEVSVPASNPNGSKALFILDTGLTGETQPLVNYFIRQCKSKKYLNEISHQLLPLNERAISAFLQGDTETLKLGMKSLSSFTLKHFSPMIPKPIKDVWMEGLENGHYSLKLCGSGGGGMMLGYTDDFETTQKLINQFNITPVFRF